MFRFGAGKYSHPCWHPTCVNRRGLVELLMTATIPLRRFRSVCSPFMFPYSFLAFYAVSFSCFRVCVSCMHAPRPFLFAWTLLPLFARGFAPIGLEVGESTYGFECVPHSICSKAKSFFLFASSFVWIIVAVRQLVHALEFYIFQTVCTST